MTSRRRPRRSRTARESGIADSGRLRWCLRSANGTARLVRMETLSDPTRERLVVVPVGALDDLLELARGAADRLPVGDPVADAIRGASAEVRARLLLEP